MEEDEKRESTRSDQVPKILIVEDDPANLEALCDVLDDSGYQIVAVEDGENALHQVEQIRPDLILLAVCRRGNIGSP